ncbi:MAG: HD domain-containing protein [Methylotenera sp.]|nr:HD domain-containing protein [Oligoflexia bacterium]
MIETQFQLRSVPALSASPEMSRVPAPATPVVSGVAVGRTMVERLELLNRFFEALRTCTSVVELEKTTGPLVRELLGCEVATLSLNTDLDFRMQTENLLLIPVRTRDRALGTLCAARKINGSFGLEDHQLLRGLAHQVATAWDTLDTHFHGAFEALAEAIEKKDRYTGGHTKRVVHYSLCIARHLGLGREDLEKVRFSALLHDVGKIGIEDRILKKEASLSIDEWTLMQSHPQFGFDILSRIRVSRRHSSDQQIQDFQDIVDGVRYHHERWDGLGYPSKLQGEQIPLIARIVAVADTYDAMVSTRPYRKGQAPELAFQEIVRHEGAQFDPRVVRAFRTAYETDFKSKKTLVME